jgi:DNA-binding MarR family transcriptional regulator
MLCGMDAQTPPRRPATVPQALGRLRVALDDTYAVASRELGLTAQQAELLCAAMRPSAIGDLAHVLRCDRSNVSRLVERAARRGLVSRRGAHTDGRVTMIELTPQGARLARQFIHKLESRLEPLLREWSADQHASAVATLSALADALQAPPPTPPTPAPDPLPWTLGVP